MTGVCSQVLPRSQVLGWKPSRIIGTTSWGNLGEKSTCQGSMNNLTSSCHILMSDINLSRWFWLQLWRRYFPFLASNFGMHDVSLCIISHRLSWDPLWCQTWHWQGSHWYCQWSFEKRHIHCQVMGCTCIYAYGSQDTKTSKNLFQFSWGPLPYLW